MTGAGSGGQGPSDGSDGEEPEKCPVCLGAVAGAELAMPDSCCHVFCLRCLLTWAQMSPSCPVDRRPFSNVYRWDGDVGLVQIPVRRQNTQLEADICCCRKPEHKVCLKNKPDRRLRQQKTKRKSDIKTRGLVRKCNDEEPSSLSRKKVKGTECCMWSPPPCVPITAPTQDIADPVWLAEHLPYDTGFKPCKLQAQSCPWLSSAAPILADGTSRRRFPGWNNSPPFGLISSPLTSNSPFSSSNFDPPKSDPPPPQVVPGNAAVAVLNVLPPPPPPQLSLLHHQYPMQRLQGPLPVSLQPAAPYAMPPQVPMHLHPAVTLLQVPTVATQGLPPPPPPPPPMQAGNQTIAAAAQPEGHTAQMVSAVVGYGKSSLLPTPAKVAVATVSQVPPAPSQVMPSSTTQSSQHSKAQADSSKKEKKQQIQEKAINEVKTAIKPFYQKKEITKEEYKEIVRKAVEKVCNSKSGEVNSSKVANLVKAYVDKYKHARKK
ncbi:protein SCAF11 isoform X3 [Fundulus heteroclitus]|uniref:protein SCAF11 isoform X3 n=1 Tax=Fundulus heteroclitus TaxID=8078 RepID=UPI00165A7913|nr:protein SCAF11 isoform X3 [Fundulus heteroclitus]